MFCPYLEFNAFILGALSIFSYDGELGVNLSQALSFIRYLALLSTLPNPKSKVVLFPSKFLFVGSVFSINDLTVPACSSLKKLSYSS